MLFILIWVTIAAYKLGLVADFSLSDVAYLLGPMIAAVVGMIASENHKENELSKHREKWCSEVRELIAKFTYNSDVFANKAVNLWRRCGEDPRLFLTNCEDVLSDRESMEQMLTTHNQLKLLLERSEQDKNEQVIFKKVVEIKLSITDMNNDIVAMMLGHEPTDLNKVSDRINDLVQTDAVRFESLLSKVGEHMEEEWRKIKKGSLEHRIRKRWFITLILAIAIFFFSYGAGFKNSEDEKLKNFRFQYQAPSIENKKNDIDLLYI